MKDNIESGQTQTLLIQGNKWEILQHLEWMNGHYSFFIEPGSPVDAFNLNIRWSFRSDMAALIGAIKLLEEGNNTRIVFVTKPFPTKEGPNKFLEFIQRIRDYFGDTIIVGDDSWKPTNWERVDRTINKIKQALFTAKDEEDFQEIGLLCREAMISLAQAVYDQKLHGPIDENVPSKTDAKSMIKRFINYELPKDSNEELVV